MARSRPSLLTLLQPSVRVTRPRWTPALCRAAEVAADSGRMMMAADLCEAMIGDDRVRGCLEQRIDGLLDLPIKFEAAGDGRRRGRAVKALEAGADWWRMLPEPEQRRFLAWGLLLGVTPGRIAPWTRDPDTGRVVPQVVHWHPRDLCWDGAGWTIKVDATGRAEHVVPGDGTWLLFAPYGSARPWSYGLWRTLWRPWLSKAYARDDADRAGEVAGLLAAESPAGMNRQLRDELVESLNERGADAIVAPPPGVKLYAVGDTQKGASADKRVSDANDAIAIAIVGQNLTTSVTGGSLAAARQHGGQLTQKISADGEVWGTTVRAQVLERWSEYNFGSAALAPWPVYDTSPPEDLEARSKTQLATADAIKAWRALGVEVDVEAMAEDVDVPVTKVKDPPPPPVPPPPPPPPGGDVPAPAEPGDDQAQPAPTAMARTASGLLAGVGSGFVQGQLYTDRVGDAAIADTQRLMAPQLRELLDLVEGAEDYETLRGKLVEHFAALAPDALSLRLEGAMVLAGLAGMLAVDQDAPGARG